MNKRTLTGDVSHFSQGKFQQSIRWILLSLVAILGLTVFHHFEYLSLGRKPKTELNTIKYSGEHINWEPCGDLKGDPLECSSINVPIDQFAQNPDPNPNQTFAIPLMRLRAAKATQNLLVNPGGPGASGIDLLYRRGSQLRAIVGEGFHLLSFDPRGVNSSIPAASCYPDDETRRRLSGSSILNPLLEASTIYAWAKNFAQACSDTMGEYASYINTPQTAADMNSILNAVGQRDMIYWGFSYGSLLGQTYAGLFPERTQRVIIDGVVNQFKWYDGIYEIESQVNVEEVLDGFFEECLKTDNYSCPLFDLTVSKDPRVLSRIVRSYIDDLGPNPLNVYLNSSAYGILNFDHVWRNGVLPALYNPAGWSFLADVLCLLIRGDATRAFLAFGTNHPQRDESSKFVTLNDGLSGPDHWPQSSAGLIHWMLPYLLNSSLTPSDISLYFLKQQWKLPRTHSYVPRRGVETAHPLLILSTTYDAITPLVSAVSANEPFDRSQIIEVEGYGHSSLAVASVCVVKHVRAFLYEGIMPSNYTKCEVDSPYFIRKNKNDKVPTRLHFQDPEDQIIHDAQLEFVTGWEVIL
jgi:pimeloyl-ACP methyl ester carboxylesterase